MTFSLTELFYFILLAPPIFAAIAATGLLKGDFLHWINRLVALSVGAAAACFLVQFDADEVFNDWYFYMDSLSLWMVLIIITLYQAFAWTSRAYLDRDKNIRYGYLRRFQHLEGRFYALSHLFVWTMLLVVVVNNLGLMWVTIEMTTLVSTLLVAFKYTRTSLEAAWKYVMVCTVGICLALLGTILIYYAQIDALGTTQNALDWQYLAANSSGFNPMLATIAFCFVFVGYGTKAGLAPMHAWLPDAHSEAPALTSGLLSGALCICAIYVMLRNIIVLLPAIGVDFISELCLVFGLLTIGLAIPFVVVQRDLKRMLAYSSMENFGLMIAGFGLFLPISTEAGLLHMMNHALVKYALFYTAGTIMEAYSTKNMMRIHGMFSQSPRTAFFWLIGIVGILGMPPMGIFFSKFYIISGFFKAGHAWQGILTLVLLAGILFGILYHVLRMVGNRPTRRSAGELLGTADTIVLTILLFGSGLLGATIEELPHLGALLKNAAAIIVGGAV
ncbi:hypothetical protein TAMA11512_13670 [Selenomonas sp. TAMA-11512]|uniref:proton-conducting transporter transmembrane domain-containing protein n=1 Tax=Selenomonas sp. TAMA-11512 TaxID=3095337 RepID=UPI00308AD7DA|nr:hypothetical protein TAMA11512_13670 [Selenomonas sp. TAMA-11512]